MAVTDWATTAGGNTSIEGINVAENCSPANINDVIRAMAAAIRNFSDDVGDGAAYQPLDATLTAVAGLTTAANKGVYVTGSDAFSTYDLTAYGRTLAGLADAAALRTSLGAVTITAASLANPGYIKINVSGVDLMFQWGTGSLAANSSGTITYPQTFNTFAVCVASGGSSDTGNEGDAHVTGASGMSSQAITNSGSGAAFYSWFAVGRG